MSLDTAAEARGSVTWKVRGGYSLLLEADVYINVCMARPNLELDEVLREAADWLELYNCSRSGVMKSTCSTFSTF